MHGAAPYSEHFFPLSMIFPVQHLSPSRPPNEAQPDPPHAPHSACPVDK